MGGQFVCDVPRCIHGFWCFSLCGDAACRYRPHPNVQPCVPLTLFTPSFTCPPFERLACFWGDHISSVLTTCRKHDQRPSHRSSTRCAVYQSHRLSMEDVQDGRYSGLVQGHHRPLFAHLPTYRGYARGERGGLNTCMGCDSEADGRLS